MRRSALLVPSGLWTPKRYVRGEGQPATLMYGRYRIWNADGSMASESEWQPNALANEGETDCLNTWLRGAKVSSEYAALLPAAPTLTSTMKTMTEVFAPGSNGYRRQPIEISDWGAPALDGGYYEEITAAEKVFGPATEKAWENLTHVALVTTATGTSGQFLLYVGLSGTVTVKAGQSLGYALKVQLQ